MKKYLTIAIFLLLQLDYLNAIITDTRELTGHAIEAIEKGNLSYFKALVPSFVPADAKSTQGRSLLEIAKYHNKSDFVDYLNSLKSTKYTGEESSTTSQEKAYLPRFIGGAEEAEALFGPLKKTNTQDEEHQSKESITTSEKKPTFSKFIGNAEEAKVLFSSSHETGWAIQAIEDGNLRLFKEYVPSIVSPNAKSSHGYTLLQIANFHHKPEFVDYLKSVGANN